MLSKKIFLLWVVITAGSAIATQPVATITRIPTLSGNGCPQSSYSIALSPDNAAVSIIFDSFSAAKSASQPGYESKFCSITVPIQVQSGYQIRLKSFSLRGFSAISSKSYGTLFSTFTEKSQRKTYSTLSTFKYFPPFFESDFEIDSRSRLPALGCQNSNVEFTFKTWISAYAQRKSSSSGMVTLDSFDLSLNPDESNSQVEITRCR